MRTTMKVVSLDNAKTRRRLSKTWIFALKLGIVINRVALRSRLTVQSEIRVTLGNQINIRKIKTLKTTFIKIENDRIEYKK